MSNDVWFRQMDYVPIAKYGIVRTKLARRNVFSRRSECTGSKNQVKQLSRVKFFNLLFTLRDDAFDHDRLS